jgi:hypothetical protein
MRNGGCPGTTGFGASTITSKVSVFKVTNQLGLVGKKWI